MPLLIDGRELEPPEPLQRVLAALDTLERGQELRVWLYCHPVPLFSILQGKAFAWDEEILGDGTHEIRIRRTGP
jgi:uncharacterized protein (DUF2249 family)